MKTENQILTFNNAKVKINYGIEGRVLDFNSEEILIELFQSIRVGTECYLRIEIEDKVFDANGLIVMSTVSSITNKGVIFLTKIKLKEKCKERLPGFTSA